MDTIIQAIEDLEKERQKDLDTEMFDADYDEEE